MNLRMPVFALQRQLKVSEHAATMLCIVRPTHESSQATLAP